MRNEKVIVVGGGLGGLTAAVRLAQSGVPVTLYEKEPWVGGYAVTFTRKGRTADVALHAVAAGGPGQEFRNLADELGLGNDVRFIRLANGFHVRLGDYAFRMPNAYAELFRALEEAFPAERNGLRAFRADLEKYAAIYGPVFRPGVSRWRSLPPFILHIAAFLRHAGLPVRAYLQRYVRDPRLMALLFQSSIFLGIPMDELPTLTFMLMFRILFGEGMYTIAGGGQALTDALEKRLRHLGGAIVTGTEVRRILVEGRRVTGIVTARGETHHAAAVAADVSLPRLVDELVGRDRFPAAYLETVSKLRPSLSILAFNFWLDCRPRELGITDHITVVFPSADVDAHIKTQRAACLLAGFSITAHGNTEPDLDAPDRAAVSVVGGTNAPAWLAMGDAAYRQAKQAATDDILRKLDRLYPGFAGRVTFLDLATPRTMFRYTGNPDGAIMGFNGSCGMNRWIMAAGRLPIAGLEPAGAWTGRMGGMMQCMHAGRDAAEKILHTLRRTT